METLDGRRRRTTTTHLENQVFLSRLRDRKTRLGIQDPKVEVRFNDLSIEADVVVGERTLPTLLNVVFNAAEELLGSLHLCPTKQKPLRILKALNGIIKPSRMTLVLGPPGCGKSTLLRALAGKHDSNLRVTGGVTYNGQPLTNFVPQRTCAYVSQHDLHHPEMTVRETLDFSMRLLGTGNRSEHAREFGREQREAAGIEPDIEMDAFIKAATDGSGRNYVTDYVLGILGLQDCADIMIGDEMRRGISGGQKKRVTIGEMLVGLARAFFMDDISNGLDSSTTFEIVKYLREMVHLMDLTMVISLLQPSPETYDLFDDIILLCEGQIVYHGPRDNVLEFFKSLGFRCPERKNIADFLQEVTSKMDQEQYWANVNTAYQYVPVKKFAESFRSSHHNRHIELRPFDQIEDSSLVSKGNFRISKWEIFKTCFSRELLLMKRNSPAHLFKAFQILVLASVVMTLFLRTVMKHDSIVDANRYMGAVLSGAVVMNLTSLTELIMTIRRLPTFYRQRELLLLPGWALLVSIFILSLPISLIETGIWTCLSYYVIGFAPSGTRFFQYFLALFFVHQTSTSLFRFISTVSKSEVMANAISVVSLVASYSLGGFVISKDDIKSWFAWGSWLSPMTYAQNALAINEFLDKRWNMPIYDIDFKEETVGRLFLKLRGMFTEWYWYWICIGALLGFTLLFNLICIVALEFKKVVSNKNQVSLLIEAKNNKHAEIVDIEEATDLKCGMVLPFQPITLAFSHISYYIDMPTEMKKHGYREKRLQLLKDVNGAFRPRVLTALMGVTGAGKTTLLDVLAGRKTGGYIEGSITVSGYPKRQETFARICGYCEQTDIHSPFVTVYESLQYSAWLRLPAEIKPQIRNEFVDEVMDLIELRPLKNAMVGLPGISGLSTEQRKRLTIAVELVSSPSIIFMDEPTSGLDARAAAIVMRTVRNTVNTGRTVVCTIHQPSIEIFEAFDELLLMKSEGQLIYGGPLGTFSKSMVLYFEALPGVPKIRAGQNPAVWMLEVSSPAMEVELGLDFAEAFRNSSLYQKNTELLEELSKSKSNAGDLHFPSKYAQGFAVQCIACLWKQHCSYWKNPEQNNSRFIIAVVISVLFGTIFWDIGSEINTAEDVYNVLGALYGSALFLGFSISAMIQPIVGLERIVFYRETAAGMYSSMPYAIAQVSIEIPYLIIEVLIFTLIVYPMIGFPWAAVKFLWFTFFMLLNFTYYVLFGIMAVALTPNREIAGILSFFLFVVWNIFSGFYIPRQTIPIWWRWYYWVDPASWTIYGLMVSQLADQVGLIHVPGQADQTVKEFIEDFLGLKIDHLVLIVCLHLGIIVLFLFVYGFGIKYLNFQKR